MSFMDNVKSLFGGNVEEKATELIDKIVNQVKPYLEKGEADANTALQSAIASYDDLSGKLKGVVGKMGTAADNEKANLTKEKDSLVASIVAKGKTILEGVKANKDIPDSIKELCTQAETLLEKLG